MSDTIQDKDGRRSLITGMGIAAASLTLGASAARAQSSATFQPVRHRQDAWLDELPGKHRVFIDTSSASGGGEGLLYANNIFNVHESAYSGGPEDYAMVVCFRHFSTPFGYNDAIWQKYGETFYELMQQFADPSTGGAASVNLMNTTDRPTLPNLGNTIDSVAAKGTIFAICNAATQFIAGQISEAIGAETQDVYDELVASAIPNSRFVSAGVIALTRAQEYGYSLLSAG
jgi:hypothetical protein